MSVQRVATLLFHATNKAHNPQLTLASSGNAKASDVNSSSMVVIVISPAFLTP